jgi:DNA-directed RNA polymerase subunit M/transcription elongation factor TFIIS
MATSDAASEWLRLTAHYRGMSDGELLSLARDSSKLTEAAQQILKAEFSARHLELPPPGEPGPPPEPETDPDSPYAEDRELVEIRTVWKLPDALQLQWLLDRAGIPFYMGDEKATGVDKVMSNFGGGVSVKVMRVGSPYAGQALKNYQPANEPPEEQEGPHPGEEEIPIACPKCRSTEVVFEGLASAPTTKDNDSSQNFQWVCDSCGYEWDDEGIVKNP